MGGGGGMSHTPESVYKQLMKFKALSMKEQNKYHESGGGFYDWYAEQQPQPKVKLKPQLQVQVQAQAQKCSLSKTCEKWRYGDNRIGKCNNIFIEWGHVQYHNNNPQWKSV